MGVVRGAPIASVLVLRTRPQVPPNCDLTLGMVCIDKSPGRTVWRMTAHERFANPAGVVQGGFLAAFCDSAMGAAAVTFAEGRAVRVANADLKISFLRPVAVGSLVTCEATVVAGGRRVAFVEATVTMEPGQDGRAGRDGFGAEGGVGGDGRDGTPGRSAGGPVARASSTYLFSERD